MKVRALIAAGLIAVTGAGVLAPAAQAEDTVVTFTLTNGSLSISVPAGSDASPRALTLTPSIGLTGTVLTGSLGDNSAAVTTVTDNRNALTGWTAYANASDFTRTLDAAGNAATSGSIAKSAVNIKVRTADVVSQKVGTATILTTDSTQLFVPVETGATGGASASPIGVATANLTSLVSTLLQTTANNEVKYNPFLTVTVPPNTPSGTYKGTISQTVI